jgi:hypothetical protein
VGIEVSQQGGEECNEFWCSLHERHIFLSQACRRGARRDLPRKGLGRRRRPASPCQGWPLRRSRWNGPRHTPPGERRSRGSRLL